MMNPLNQSNQLFLLIFMAIIFSSFRSFHFAHWSSPFVHSPAPHPFGVSSLGTFCLGFLGNCLPIEVRPLLSSFVHKRRLILLNIYFTQLNTGRLNSRTSNNSPIAQPSVEPSTDRVSLLGQIQKGSNTKTFIRSPIYDRAKNSGVVLHK